MPEACNLESVTTQVAQAHDPLLDVLIGEHQAEVEDIGGSVADEEDAAASGQESQVALGVTGRMQCCDPSPHRDLVTVFHQNVCVHRGDGSRLGSDNAPKQEGVEDARRGEEGAHGAALRHERCIPAVHEDSSRGPAFQLSEVPGVVGVAVGHEDLAEIRRLCTERTNDLEDPACVPRETSVDQAQTVGFRFQEERVDPRKSDLMQSGQEFVNPHCHPPLERSTCRNTPGPRNPGLQVPHPAAPGGIRATLRSSRLVEDCGVKIQRKTGLEPTYSLFVDGSQRTRRPEWEAGVDLRGWCQMEDFLMRRHGRTRLSTSFLVTVLFSVSCSDAPQWTGSVEVRDGIEVISNPGDPFLREDQGFMSELWEVRGSDWVDPSRVHAQSGLITVVDPPANQVHLVSASGEPRASIGQLGGGPGEFLRLLDAFPDGDRLVVLDGGRGSVQYLDLQGGYLSSRYLEGQPWDGFLLESRRLLVKGEFLSDPTEESFGDWVTVSDDGKPTAFTSHTLDPLPEEQGVQCSDLSPWAGGAARLRFTTPQIQIFGPGGGLRREIRVDLPVEPVSPAERDLALSELQRTLVGRGLPSPFIQQSLVVMEERWRVKCRFGPLRFDPSGRFAAFLEQNPDDFGSGAATLHFLSPDGVYLARVTFPTPWRDFVLDDGVVYALTRDPATDEISLTANRVEFPSALPVRASGALEDARRASSVER